MSKNQSTTLDGATGFVENPLYEAEWKETIIPEQPDKKCQHYFEFRDVARCTRCGLGLYGVIEIKDGRPLV